MTGIKLFFQHFVRIAQFAPDFSVAEHYGLCNTMCLYTKVVASDRFLQVFGVDITFQLSLYIL
jgi:hypothetical protein